MGAINRCSLEKAIVLGLEGCIVLDHYASYPAAIAALAEGMKGGRLKHRLDVVEGLEKAGTAVSRLFTGGNNGKLLVRPARGRGRRIFYGLWQSKLHTQL